MTVFMLIKPFIKPSCPVDGAGAGSGGDHSPKDRNISSQGKGWQKFVLIYSDTSL